MRRGQAMVEMALVMPLLLFTIGSGFDVLRGTYTDGLVVQATGYGAQLAAAGRADAEVVQAVVQLGQGAVRAAGVQVTPCRDRALVGSSSTVTAAWQFVPLFPTTIWGWAWLNPEGRAITHSVTLTMQMPCVVPL